MTTNLFDYNNTGKSFASRFDTSKADMNVGTMSVERHVNIYDASEDMAEFVALSGTELTAALSECESFMKDAMDNVSAAADDWAKAAYRFMLARGEQERRRRPPVTHTFNKWEPIREDSYRVRDSILAETISNMVYEMKVYVREDYRYPRRGGQPVKVYTVDWGLYAHNPANHQGGHNVPVSGQRDKQFETDEAALKYVNGRKKAYERYFKEVSPAVPRKYAPYFVVHGVPLDGYTLEPAEDESK